MQQVRTQFHKQLPGFDVFGKFITPLGVLGLIATCVWIYGPTFSIYDNFPLADADKRYYVITALFALWFLKFLLIDMNIPNPFTYKDAQTRKQLATLKSRFTAAFQFLKKTTVTRADETVHLSDLPSYLLIGPAKGGKTTLLANASVHYVLQRQFKKQDLQCLPPTQNCDWWVTKELSIIDVPGKYIQTNPVMWRFFLRMMKKFSGKQAIKGIIIALPLAEIIKNKDTNEYQLFLKELFLRIHEMQKFFSQPLPCQILVTKCDLLPGFVEFFGESNNEETRQAWGIAINHRDPRKINELFANRFDALIKKLNEQLIWRIHQERNPLARPYIKDFPLQVERLKENLNDFIKKLIATKSNLILKGVYLTSAIQTKSEPEVTVIDAAESNERGLQLFKAPQPLTRPYFIKQFLMLGLQEQHATTVVLQYRWKSRMAITASVAAIAVSGYVMGHDFQAGVKQAYAMQNNISEYQVTVLKAKDPDEQLRKTVELLNSLFEVSKNSSFRFDIRHLVKFYSYKSQQKAAEIYKQALQTILLPEIKNYLAQFLKNPVNKNNDRVYAALKSYLMLGDAGHMQPDYVISTMHSISSRALDKNNLAALNDHLSYVLNGKWNTQTLDSNIVDETRRYLKAIPTFDLSYIILKTYNDNSVNTTIDIGAEQNAVFTVEHAVKEIPTMFTAKNFATVYGQQTIIAASEATTGNWVLGENMGMNIRPQTPQNIVEQLRTSYVNNYVDIWEGMINNVHLNKSTDLQQTMATINILISDDSPLLHFIQTVHENTNFEPLTAASQRLEEVNSLIASNGASQQKLYQLFSALRSAQTFLQEIQSASNEPKAAFEAVSKRMQNQAEPDMLTQLRFVAINNPEPIKSWLLSIANDSWHYLMQDASRYINTAWEEKVTTPYQEAIANRYPFTKDSDKDVELSKFVSFFGNPGILLSFYNDYLKPFVDSTPNDWRWKKMDDRQIPFSNATLRQIQLGIRIHQTFFPNDDDKLYVEFALQPHNFSKSIKSVKLNINDKSFVDNDVRTTAPHMASWPTTSSQKMAAVQLRLRSGQPIDRTIPGDWAWFKLVNQSVQNMVTKKELLLNFSKNDTPAQYLLFTESALNPFLSLNLNRLKLPAQLTTTGES